MTSKFIVMFLAVFSMWNIADADTGESLEMRIYDRDVQPMTEAEMRMILEKADLEKHGFKLEIISKLVSETGTGSEPTYQKAYFYYKIVDCSRVPEVNEELEYLIPGVLGGKIITRIRGEIRNRNLDHLKKCQTGLEVHFKQSEGCYNTKKEDRVRRAKKNCNRCWWCGATKVLVGN